MEKRTLIALGLSFVVLAFYPVVLEKFYPGYTKSDRAPRLVQKTTASASEKRLSDASSDESVLLPSDDVTFERTSRLLFNLKPGAIRQAEFPTFRDSHTIPLRLFSLTHMAGAPLSLEFYSDTPVTPEKYAFVGTQQGFTLTSRAPEAGLTIVKSVNARPEEYAFDFGVTFRNDSAKPIAFSYDLSAGHSFPQRNSIDAQYSEANFYSAAGKLRHEKNTKAGKTVELKEPLRWLAVKDRHFSVIVQPKDAEFTGRQTGTGKGFEAALASPQITVPAGQSVTHRFLVYVGPNDIEKLLPLGLDPIINFGKLDPIGRFLVGGLELLHKVLRNYGLAIIALTMSINIVLFPLTRASYMSMKRMQLVQPHMTKLREQHKKSPEKLNKEMMELYKKHKVNPFGGCLPMILQMPVFIALYVALSKTVSLMNARFLWIRDLSSPDIVPLPFALPFVGAEFHALPLIMTAATFIQQKFTQVKMEGQDPAMEQQQKMMAYMMPVMFLFIFYTMPSGLVLYWLTNTVLMSLYQFRLKRMKLS